MEKAYDIKLLGQELKAQGLDLAEDAVENAAKGIFSWLKKSAELSETPYDNMAFTLALPKIEEICFKAIDKIDGQEG